MPNLPLPKPKLPQGNGSPPQTGGPVVSAGAGTPPPTTPAQSSPQSAPALASSAAMPPAKPPQSVASSSPPDPNMPPSAPGLPPAPSGGISGTVPSLPPRNAPQPVVAQAGMPPMGAPPVAKIGTPPPLPAGLGSAPAAPPARVPAPGTATSPAPTAPAPVASKAAPAASGAAAKPAVQPAAAKKSFFAGLLSSPLKIGGIVVAVLAVLGIAGYFGFQAFFGGGSTTVDKSPADKVPVQAEPKQITLTYWGLWEPTSTLTSVLKDFETANPGLKVDYVQQTHKDYRERLQTAIAAGNGPDLFRFHYSWTPMLSKELASMPASVMSASEYQKTFYPIAAQGLQVNGQIVGVPLMYDGLALYYNKDILQTAGEQPPQTWAELKTLATKLTVRSGDSIERGGLAIGNASNVEHFSDIIGLLMIQNGADPSDPTSKEAQEALQFYTNFAKDGVWDATLPSSTVAFARGEAAMMFAPSWRAHEVSAINKNLNFGVTRVPTLGDQQIGWATFWAEGVNNKSANKEPSWKLIKYLSSKEVMQKLYADQSKVRDFGEIYSRVDLANTLSSDSVVAPFLQDAPQAQGWYLNSFTFDNGINDQIIKYYRDAINALDEGKVIDKVMVTVGQGTTQVLKQYGVSTGTPTPPTQ